MVSILWLVWINYAPSTIHAYIQTVGHFACCFHCSRDRLGTEHIRRYQARSHQHRNAP